MQPDLASDDPDDPGPRDPLVAGIVDAARQLREMLGYYRDLPPDRTTPLKAAYFAARDFLRAHPTYVVAAGLAVAAIGNFLAGRPTAALDSLMSAASVLGIRFAVGAAPKG